MSKLWIAQIAMAVVTLFALLVIGMHLFGWGRVDPDVILPWAYTAAASQCGMLICLFLRLFLKRREERGE